MRIGVFGGSFDPVHKGHITAALQAAEKYRLSIVFFVLNSRPPHKKVFTSAIHRYRMLSLAIQEIPFFRLSPAEMDEDRIHFTVDSVKYFTRLYREEKLFFIIGADSLADLPGWREGSSLLMMADFIVAARPGTGTGSSGGVHCSRKSLTCLKRFRKVGSRCPFSSSEIRDKLKKNGRAPGMLDDKVMRYIGLNKLYDIP